MKDKGTKRGRVNIWTAHLWHTEVLTHSNHMCITSCNVHPCHWLLLDASILTVSINLLLLLANTLPEQERLTLHPGDSFHIIEEDEKIHIAYFSHFFLYRASGCTSLVSAILNIKVQTSTILPLCNTCSN